MKKTTLILAFAFVGAYSNLNATEVAKDDLGRFTYDQCDAFATVWGDIYELSHEEEYEVFAKCMDTV